MYVYRRTIIPCTKTLLVFTVLCSFGFLDAAAKSVSGVTYYIGPGGKDENSGTSIGNAWLTIDRANHQTFKPGDRLLFASGKTFSGNLVLDAGDAGTPAHPVVIGSYGNGRARIEAGEGTALQVENAGGVIIENLIVSGNGRRSNTGTGVRVIHTLPGGRKMPFIRIRNVEASGFGRAGVLVGGLSKDGSQSGFEDVRIENCDVHDNVFYGIVIAGPWDDDHSETVTTGPQDAGWRPGYTNRNVQIRHCRAWRNEGDPDYHKNHSGSGILMADTDGGLIERCVAWENGRLCTKAPGGPCGIWTAGSDRVTIQFCESFRNHAGPDTADGDGFDLDGGMTNSVLQYNYSHDNDGHGILLCSYKGAPHEWRNNVVRFNISDNDGRAHTPNAAMAFWTDEPELAGIEIYNNTVIVNPAADGNLPVVIRAAGNIRGARLRNNLFIATSGCALIDDRTDGQGMMFQGNAYWTEGGPVRILWAGSEHNSIDGWRNATGQEKLDNQAVGLFADPRLDLFGRGMNMGDAMRLPALPGYRLRPNSPLIGTGTSLGTMNVGQHDFFGTPLLQNGKPDIGAYAKPRKKIPDK